MRIVRYCGRERLPGGERLWRKLAKAAGFDGTLKVYGYGAGQNKAARSQIAFDLGRTDRIWAIGLYTYPGNLIEVWLPCKCQAALDEIKDFTPEESQPKWLPQRYEPLYVFAHELGHHMQYVEEVGRDEAGATKRGNNLLEKVCRSGLE